jgi:hypothetical protein
MPNPNLPYQVVLTWGAGLDTVDQWDQVIDWCIDTFGVPGAEGCWSATTNISEMEFEFQNPQDRSLFVLKMGGDSCKVLS